MSPNFVKIMVIVKTHSSLTDNIQKYLNETTLKITHI